MNKEWFVSGQPCTKIIIINHSRTRKHLRSSSSHTKQLEKHKLLLRALHYEFNWFISGLLVVKDVQVSNRSWGSLWFDCVHYHCSFLCCRWWIWLWCFRRIYWISINCSLLSRNVLYFIKSTQHLSLTSSNNKLANLIRNHTAACGSTWKFN